MMIRAIAHLARFRLGLYLSSGFLASILFYIFPLIPGLIIRPIFDALTGQAQVTWNVWLLIALLVAVAVGRSAALLGAAVAETTVQQVASALLRKNLLERILQYPGARALPASPGEALSRFRDDVEVIVTFLTWTLDPVGQCIMGIFALVVLVRINKSVALAVFIPLLVALVIVNMTTKRIQQYRKANQAAIGQVTGLLGEIFGAVQAVQTAGAQQPVVQHLSCLNDMRRTAAIRDQVLTQVLNSLSLNAGNIGIGILLLVAAPQVRAGQFTVGDFALFASYLAWLSMITNFFGNFLTRFRQVGISFTRLQELLPDEDPDTLVRHGEIGLRHEFQDIPTPIKTAADRLERLEVSNLCYRYPESGRGIAPMSFKLERGSFTVIAGRIGSGKTTLVRVLLGLLPRDAGQILWNGFEVRDPATFFVPPRCAYTPQVPVLYSESLRENILLGLSEDKVNLEVALRSAVLEDDLKTLDRGLDTLVGPRGVKLSGGQAQRTAAARMFVRDADLLVIDDLSSALDVETEKRLWDGLFDQQKITCLAISNRRAALQRADWIFVLKNGCLEAQGKLVDLLKTSEEMQCLWQGEVDVCS